MIECKKRSMEHGMDLPHFREVELICDRREDLDNGEGSFPFWGELGIGDGAFQVSGF